MNLLSELVIFNVFLEFLIYFLFSRMCLLQTLKNVMHTLAYVKAKGVTVKFNGRGKNEPAHYCGQCEVCSFCLFCEVFCFSIGAKRKKLSLYWAIISQQLQERILYL